MKKLFLLPEVKNSSGALHSVRKMLMVCLALFAYTAVFAQPADPAPDPICDQADVISMFSNSYADVPVDTWLTTWSPPGTTESVVQIAANDTRLYENIDFLGIETIGNPIDASGMTYFNIDVWTPNMTVFRVKLVDFDPGGQTEGEIELVPIQNGWNTFSIPMADFADPALVTGQVLLNSSTISQLILSGQPIGGGTAYVDNIYFSNSNCPTAAPEPTCSAQEVISLFSDSYADVPVNTFLAGFSAPPVTLTDLQIAGNDVKLYEDVTFLGIETLGPNLIDASTMTTFNIDYWTGNATQFRIKLVDFGPTGGYSGPGGDGLGDDTEFEITFDNPAQNEWVSYQIPLTEFQGMNFDNIAQLILSGMPNGQADFFIDNIYFSTCGAPAPGACSGNVAIENLANGMDYTIVSGPDGTVEVTLTVVDNPNGLVGFFGGPGGIFQEADAGTVTYNFPGQTIGEAFVVDIFFAWEGNGGSSETITINVGDCPPPACSGNVAIENLANGMDYTIVSGPDGTVDVTMTVVDNPNGLVGFFGGPGGIFQIADAGTVTYNFPGQTIGEAFVVDIFFAWEGNGGNSETITINVGDCAPPPVICTGNVAIDNLASGMDYTIASGSDGTVDVTVTVVDNPADLVGFFGGPGGIFQIANAGTFTYNFPGQTVGEAFVVDMFFNWAAGGAGNSETITIIVGGDCTPPPPAPELPITFDDPEINYDPVNFGGNSGGIVADPNDPFNMVLTTTKPVTGAECFAGTTVGGSGLENPVAFTPDNLVISMDVLSPIAGQPILLKVEDATNPGIFVEAFASTSVAGEWETINFDFSNAGVNFNNTYDKLSIFAEFSCGIPSILSGQPYFFDNIMFCVPQAVVIECPDNVTVACDADVTAATTDLELEALGGLVSDGCAGEVMVTLSSIDIDENDICNSTPFRTITRTYTATDAAGAFDECTHVITFDNSTSGPIITGFPANVSISCVDDIMTDLDAFEFDLDCGLEGTVSVNGPIISGTEGCPNTTYAYIYRVTDDCGRSTEATQTFTIVTNDNPTITAPAGYSVTCLAGSNPNPAWATYTTACNNGVDAEVTVSGPQIFGPLDCDGTIYRYTYTVTDACGRTDSDIQDLVVENDGPQITCPAPLQVFGCLEGGYNDKIEAWIETVDATSSCGVDLTINNNFNGNAGICLGNNFTTVTFTAIDACGRFASCSGTIAITDTDPPVIYQDPQELLVACNGNTQETFNNWLATQGGAAATDACWGDQVSWTASVGSNALNCANGPQAIVVTFTATDGCGNSATTTGVFNTKLLPTTINVNGLIQREDSEPVANVTIGAYISGVPEMGMSDSAGDYAFPELDFDEDTEIVPEKNDDPLNGLSTWDLVLLQQHILGINELDSPYKRIAADINRSGNISTLDMILLRKLILHIDEEFTENTSWRFVDADYVFPNPQNPFETEFPEVYNVVGQEEEVADFIAVKIGDLNLDGNTFGFIDDSADDRDLEDLNFSVEDQELIAGEEYQIEVNALNFERITGFQYTLNFDVESVEILNVESGDLVNFNEQNFNLAKQENGAIPMSWNMDQGQDLNSRDVAFSVIIQANANVRLSDVLSISSQYTKAEAYRSSELMNVNLTFNDNGQIMTATEFRLFQNTPNPFKDATTIGFQMPEAGDVILEVFDISGRLISSETGAFAKGYNQFELEASELPNGVLYYKVSTANASKSMKMILLKK